MLAKKILSPQHATVKRWMRLRLERPFREQEKRLLLIGEKAILEHPHIQALISLDDAPKIPALERYIVSEAVLKKITGLEQPDGFAAEVLLPPPQNLSDKSYILILDRIADPGNLGTLLRTALALNWDGVVLTPGTVDLFNDKALRASMGAALRLPYARLSEEEIARMFKNHRIFTADTEGKPLSQAVLKPPLALILSSEAEGPSDWAEKLGEKITIPMSGKAESLNVASSGAILLYELRKK